ncbi:MAG TPA: DUF433 domain-containing protein [Pirellulales bacterium]|jgi:uncharacterized protein (DUF433 family)|nr:DUF433 domain-containing protein [Pirellulales bacterium]
MGTAYNTTYDLREVVETDSVLTSLEARADSTMLTPRFKKDQLDFDSFIKHKVPSETERIIATPRICGGHARVNGTRIPVWGIELLRRAGKSARSIIRSYRGLTLTDVLAAFSYADSHRQEIDDAIKSNEGV